MTFAAAFCGGALFPFEVSMSINSIEELNALVARVKKPSVSTRVSRNNR